MNDTNPRQSGWLGRVISNCYDPAGEAASLQQISLDEVRDQQREPIDLPAFSQDEPDPDLIFDMSDVAWAAVAFVCTLLFVWWLA